MVGACISVIVAAGVTFRSANASEGVKPPEPAALSALAAGKVAPAPARALARASMSMSRERTTTRNCPGRRFDSPGARARIVENPVAELDSARTTLKQDATIPGTAELQRTKRDFRTFTGGDAITGGGGRCSPGFNMVQGGEPYS